MAITQPIRIGTRGSPLALAQAHETRRRLAGTSPQLAEEGALEIVEIKTTGDRIQDRALAEVGGKGLFSKEIDGAMLNGEIDIAVHSMKDVETWLPDGIVLAAVLEREDPRDAFVCLTSDSLAALPAGSTVGTSSLRRQAQLLHRRPDLKVDLLRGNVQTRLRKLDAGEADATFLAIAGLNRLDMAHVATEVLDPADLLPAVAQGAIGITCRGEDADLRDLLQTINHEETGVRISSERAMLAALDGSCRTPIGGLAEFVADGALRLRGLVGAPDGSRLFETERLGAAADAEAMGRDAGEELRRRAGDDLFE